MVAGSTRVSSQGLKHCMRTGTWVKVLCTWHMHRQQSDPYLLARSQLQEVVLALQLNGILIALQIVNTFAEQV